MIIKIVDQTDKLKLEQLHKESRETLRSVYRVKENLPFINIDPLDKKTVILKIDGQILASCRILYYENRIHIIGIAVLKSYRKQGLCKALIDFIKKEAKRKNMDILSLYTIEETGNVQVFNKYGFKVITREKTRLFESDGYDELNEVYMEVSHGSEKNF